MLVLSFQFESLMATKKRPAAATGTPTKRPTDGEVGEEGTKEKVDTTELAEAEALAEAALEEKPEKPDSEKQRKDKKNKGGKQEKKEKGKPKGKAKTKAKAKDKPKAEAKANTKVESVLDKAEKWRKGVAEKEEAGCLAMPFN